MAIYKDDYKYVRPTLAYLKDPVILAQAWKKNDSHIRYSNWFADTLELDITQCVISEKIDEWSEQLSKKLQLDTLRLIPAPKNTEWHFPSNEKPSWECKSEEIKLRPLAHVPIREQTYATAAMICLADAIETLQGNLQQKHYHDLHKNHVYSYGSRLFCDWTDNLSGRQIARFRWGSASTYTKFFEDYQLFLSRPRLFCQENQFKFSEKDLFILSFDIKSFFDSVDVDSLVNTTKSLYEDIFLADKELIQSTHWEDKTLDQHTDKFWKKLKEITSWSWEKEDITSYANVFSSNQSLPLGIPQGLVASGFFANVYMIQFDRKIGEYLDTNIHLGKLEGVNIHLIDYCRYVDDMRIVFAADKDCDLKQLQESWSEWFNKQLQEYTTKINSCKKLELQVDKTTLVNWSNIIVSGQMSEQMLEIQKGISTVPDLDSLTKSTTYLEQILDISEYHNTDSEQKNSLKLSQISIPKVDVRDDTIKRFAANRLMKVLQSRLRMSSLDELHSKEIEVYEQNSKISIEHEMEMTARRLIKSWSLNPSLITILRCGLNLFPSNELVEPIVEALKIKIENNFNGIKEHHEQLVAWFCCFYIFKLSATETAFLPQKTYPRNANIKRLRESLTIFANNILHKKETPWYVKQSALLYLSSVGKYRLKEKILGKKLTDYVILNDLTINKLPNHYKDKKKLMAILIVSLSFNKTTSNIRELLEREDNESDKLSLLKLISDYDKTILYDDYKYFDDISKKILKPLTILDNEHIKTQLKSLGSNNYSLKSLITILENPFHQENALLKLALKLLEKAIKNPDCLENIGLENILISCNSWSLVQHPKTNVEIIIKKTSNNASISTHNTPSWCKPEMAWAYNLGRILRASLIGSEDFTSTANTVLKDVDELPYRGIRSGVYKRSIGLTALNKGVGIEKYPVSSWLNRLILELLQWPGLEIQTDEITHFPDINSSIELKIIIKKRLEHNNSLFANLSGIPINKLITFRNNVKNERVCRIATVQTALPRKNDFTLQDPTNWSESFRAKHRSHLASMCRLLQHQLKITNDIYSKEKGLDLIVFPELSIHPDDLDILTSLSDTTQAAIFCGLTFEKHPYNDYPINRGVWILRQNIKTQRQIILAYQGKQHMTAIEEPLGVKGYRPYQVVVDFIHNNQALYSISASICYDATDLKLCADIRHISDCFVVSALNQDVPTFDTMAEALQFHMYQPIVIANTAEFGGSVAQAPYKKRYDRVINHTHGSKQAIINIFEIDLLDFKSARSPKKEKEKKGPPAGYTNRLG